MADARIVAIGTAVPPVVVTQSRARDILVAQPELSRVAQRLVGAAIDHSAIDERRTVIAELAERSEAGGIADATDASDHAAPHFYDSAQNLMLRPTTAVRNALYAREAGPLSIAAARSALASAPIGTRDVTQVITVSCTGFYAPGVDVELVRALGLRPDTRRVHIGFMGCQGAFPALRAAVDACQADPSAVVLVVCVELCTLHMRSSEDPEQIVSSAVFGDGAAAAVVTAHPRAGLRIDALHSELVAGSADELTWTVGDQGFDLALSSYMPRLLEAEIGAALAPLQPGESWSHIRHWAVHPGGRAIVDRVQHALGLSDEQLAPSRAVLREFGNMSSPTVLFILQRLMADARAGERIAATAFGPGVTVEAALLTVDGGTS